MHKVYLLVPSSRNGWAASFDRDDAIAQVRDLVGDTVKSAEMLTFTYDTEPDLNDFFIEGGRRIRYAPEYTEMSSEMIKLGE